MGRATFAASYRPGDRPAAAQVACRRAGRWARAPRPVPVCQRLAWLWLRQSGWTQGWLGLHLLACRILDCFFPCVLFEG
jgi:hypothetical protein